MGDGWGPRGAGEGGERGGIMGWGLIRRWGWGLGWDLGLTLLDTTLNPSSARRLAASSSSIGAQLSAMGPNSSISIGREGSLLMLEMITRTTGVTAMNQESEKMVL